MYVIDLRKAMTIGQLVLKTPFFKLSQSLYLN